MIYAELLQHVQTKKASLNSACQKYDIPKATLRDLVSLERKTVPSTILNKEEEYRVPNQPNLNGFYQKTN